MNTLGHAARGLIAAAFFLVSPTQATSYSTDLSDLWWIPTESGWGMQLVQEGSTVFATLFAYGSTTQPTWAAATLQSHGEGSYIWSGALYVYTGPWFGAAFNPNLVTKRQAGTMTFQLSTVNNGNLTYTIDGTEVTKQVVRQTLVADDYSGTYTIGAHILTTACVNSASNGDVAGPMNLVVNQTGGNMTMTWTFIGGAVCTYTGPYTQNGKLGAFSAEYSCTTGDNGQLDVFEMTNRVGMIAGRISGQSSHQGCQISGYFSGIDPSLPAQLN